VNNDRDDYVAAMATMKAARIHQFGGPEVIRYEDVERPEPTSEQLLVRVHAVGVNPADWKLRAGLFGKPELPTILGYDFSGTVERPGSSDFKAGDEVFTRGQHAYAEYVVVARNEVVKKLPSLDHTRAAAIPVPGLTAWQSVDAMNLTPGQTVLVHGAAGAVGSFAVQLAKQRGANVIATAAAIDEPWLREIGVSQVIDYKTQRFEELVRDVDAVLDAVGGDTFARSWRVLKPNGVLVTTVAAGEPPAGTKARSVRIMSKLDRRQLEQLAARVAEGAIKIRLADVLPLSQARRAHELGESGKARGKLILDPTRK
jgi:NADPH:quinone reductase-like Zn-dependent oxidoreductase